MVRGKERGGRTEGRLGKSLERTSAPGARGARRDYRTEVREGVLHGSTRGEVAIQGYVLSHRSPGFESLIFSSPHVTWAQV